MSDGSIKIDVRLDSSTAKKDLQEVERVAQTSGNSIAKSFNSAEKSMKSASTAFNGKQIAKELDNVGKTIKNTTDKIELEKKKLSELKEAFEKATNPTKKNTIEKQMLQAEASVIKLETKLNGLKDKQVNLKVKMDGLNGLDGEFKSAEMSAVKSLDNVERKSEQVATSVRKNMGSLSIGEGIIKVGDKISSVGDTLTRNVTLPITAIGVAAAKVGMDFDSQMSRVKAIAGSTGEEFKQLHDQALQLGKDTAFSAKEAAEGMENLAAAGFSTQETMAAMPGLLDLAAASGESLATSSDIAASTLRGFGLEASQAGHVADVLAKNANATNAAVADTGEAMKYIAPVAHAMGLSLEEVTAAIGEMANSGIKGSQAGTTLRSALTRLASPSDEAAKAMQKLGFTAFDSKGKLKPLSDIMQELNDKTSKLTDQKKQDAIATIFGQEAMSGMMVLMQGGKKGLDDLTDSYKASEGAAKEMASTMQDNAKSAIEQMGGSIETAAIKLEEVAAPTITKIANEVQDLANKFADLSPEMQETIIKTALFAAAGGPVLKILGTTTSGIGGIIKLLAKLAPSAAGATAAMGGIAEAGTVGAGGVAALGTSLGGVLAAIAPFVLGAAAIGGVGYTIYDVMTKQAVPSVDLFADEVKYASETVQTEHGTMQKIVQTSATKISDSTKQAVQAYLDMDNNAKKYLQDLYISNSTITEQIVADTKSKFDSMAKNTISGYEKQKNDGISKLEELFSKEKILTAEQQAEILKKTNDYYSSKESNVSETEAKINKILESAKNENRSLKVEELEEIKNLENSMRDNAINALSEQESQAAVILQRMKDYDGRITAEQASEKIKALNDSRDKAIQSANDEYDSRIAIISDMRDNIGSITSDEADKMIAEAKRQRDETVAKAEETRDGAVNKIQEMNSTISNDVDINTGNILTTWDRLKAWWNSWQPQPKTVEIKTQEQAVSNAYNNAMNSQPWAQNNPYLQIGQNYTGTGGGSEGLTTINEHGGFPEITTGEQELYYLGGGTGILDSGSSKNYVDASISNQVNNKFGSTISKLITNMISQNQILSKVANNTGQAANSGLKNVQLNEKLANAIINKANSASGGFNQIQTELTNANDSKTKADKMKVEDNANYASSKAKVDDLASQIEDLKNQSQDLEDSKQVSLDKSTNKAITASNKSIEATKNEIQAKQHQLEREKDIAEKEVSLAKMVAENEIEKAKESAEQQVKIAEAKKDKLVKLVDAISTAVKNELDKEETGAEKTINDKMTSLENSYNKKLKALEEQSTETSRSDTRQEFSDKIAKLTNQMNNTQSFSDKQSYALQIKDLQKQSNKQESEWTTEDKKKALEEQYNKEKETLEKKLKDTQAYYSKLKETDSINAQTRYIMLNSNQEDLVKLLNSYNPLWQNAGQTLADSLLTGLNSQKQTVQDAVNEMIGIRDMAPPSKYFDGATQTMKGYATGTSSNPFEGYYLTNEKGPETVTQGDVAYVSKGAAIKNAMQTKQMMNEEITKQISRQVAQIKASIIQNQMDAYKAIAGSITQMQNNSKIETNNYQPTLQIQEYHQHTDQDVEQLASEFGSIAYKKRKI